MNSLNTLGNRQINSLNADLAKLESGESGPSTQGGSSVPGPSDQMMGSQDMTDDLGQITTTLNALGRVIDDYDSMARKEMVVAAREKANTSVYAPLSHDLC